MKKRSLITLLTLSACTPQIYSTPTTFVVASPASTLEQGKHAVEARGSASSLPGAGVWGVEGQYRYGLVEGIELEGRAMLLHAPAGYVEAQTGVNLTAGTKIELGTPHAALSVHAGGGTSGIGSHLGADLGLHLSYENPYVVPFANGRIGFSSPLVSELIAIDIEDDMSVHQTRFTYLWSVSTGARFKSAWFSDVGLYFDVALTLGQLYSRDSQIITPGIYRSNAAEEGGFATVSALVGYEL